MESMDNCGSQRTNPYSSIGQTREQSSNLNKRPILNAEETRRINPECGV